jgi:hypothetical protein
MGHAQGRSTRTGPRVGRAVAVLVVGLISAGALSACGSDGDAAPAATTVPATTGQPPDLVGTWVGDYAYPWNADDGTPEPTPATERLVIEHQEGGLLWGVDEYVDAGQTIRIPVRGAVDALGQLSLGEDGGSFRGQLHPDGSLVVHFVRTDHEYTAFTARLTRS